VYVLSYERLDLSASPPQLLNVRSAADFSALPSGGVQNYGNIDYISLLQNARIRVAGSAGDLATSLNAQRTIEYYQPMIEGTIIIKHESKEDFDNLDNWKTGGSGEVGDHGIVKVNDSGVEVNDDSGDNAMKVTGTESVTSLVTASYHDTGVQESLLEYKPDIAGFEDIWYKSDEKLSYEVQCKIAFSNMNDNADNNPRGTYMPGIVFRVRDTQVNSVMTKEYYGLSFMRSLFDKNDMADGDDNDIDADDIPDKHLFTNHGPNPGIPAEAVDDICVADYTAPPSWNDLPPLSGVPYMLFWQQALDFEEWDGIWTRNSDLYVDWLAYVPLCKLTPVTIYHYPAQSVSGSDSVPCAPCTACSPKTWRRYWYQGYDWSPDCCLVYQQTGSGGGFLNWWREYRWDTYDCNGSCYNVDCCGAPVTYPEGWYLGPLPSDPRTPVIYRGAYRIENHQEYGQILQPVTKNVDGTDYSIIGDMNNLAYLIRDPSTFNVVTGFRGNPIENSAFVFPDQTVSFQNNHNYRVYLKPWVTVMARIIEMKGEFYDENSSGCGNSADERVNVIQAWFGEPDTYPRGTVTWPDESSASFSEMIWPDRGYTSRTNTIENGWVDQERRLVERGDDQYENTLEKRSPLVYSNQLTSEGYDTYPVGYPPAEVGLHTFGIDVSNDDDQYNDLVYFDDFAIRLFEYGKGTGLLPGVQSE